jgi:hypothetical protein
MLLKSLLLFFITLPAWGFKFTEDFKNGFYWATLPVKFIIVDKDPVRKVLLHELALAAINQWEERSGFSLWDIKTDGTSNIIRWSTNFAEETRMDPNSVLAVAVRYTDGPYFAKSEIIINGTHGAFNSNIKNMNEMNLGTTLVHEFGHTLGLDHSENLLAVMAPTLQYPYNGLHSDDLEGMSEVHSETEHRQAIRYVSPLAYQEAGQNSKAVSCGTTGVPTSGGNFVSMAAGMLINFIWKFLSWLKSHFKIPKRRNETK